VTPTERGRASTGERAGSSAPPGERDPGRGRKEWAVDLHSHTSASYDSLTDPRELVERARDAGLHRIAVTDHNEIDGALAAREADAALVIVGEEVRTAEGLDLVGLFLHRRIPPGWSFREVAEAIHAQGGVVYLPHPFDPHRGADESFLDRVADCIDAVEGFNARVHSRAANRRARRWAREQGLPVGAGSDAHLLREVGRGRVRMPPFHDPAGFLDALARGTVEGRRSGRWVHLGSTWAKIRSKLPPGA